MIFFEIGTARVFFFTACGFRLSEKPRAQAAALCATGGVLLVRHSEPQSVAHSRSALPMFSIKSQDESGSCRGAKADLVQFRTIHSFLLMVPWRCARFTVHLREHAEGQRT